MGKASTSKSSLVPAMYSDGVSSDLSSDPPCHRGVGIDLRRGPRSDPSLLDPVSLPSRNWLREFSYLFVIVVILGLGISPFLEARVFYTQEEAFRLAFPEADRFERKTYLLTAEQVEAIERASRSDLGSKLVTFQTAWRGETVLGHLRIDVHQVRTQSEGLLVALDGKGSVIHVRVLAFHEPLDYKPVQRWYDGFQGKGSEGEIRVGHDVDAVTGATLTTRATTAAIRRTLAYYELLLSRT